MSQYYLSFSLNSFINSFYNTILSTIQFCILYLRILDSNIVIRNGKIVWKVVEIEYYLRLNLSFRRYYYPGYLWIHQNVNNECAGKSKQLFSFSDQPLGALIYVYFIVLILIYFELIIPGGNCALYGYSSFRTSPGVSLYRSNTGGTTLSLLLFTMRW